MPIDMDEIVSERITTGIRAPKVTGVFLTPKAPEKFDSSFRPTQKTQSGEFSGVTQTGRKLPKFNAMKSTQHFSESKKTCIGIRNPYALVNSLEVKYRQKISNWDEMRTAKERIEHLMTPHLTTSITGESLRFDQLFDPMYGSRLFDAATLKKYHPVKCRSITTAAPPSQKTCADATTWIASTVDWLAGSLPLYDAPRQGAGDDCWFIAALCSIAWVQPLLLTADNSCGIFILDPDTPPAGQGSLDDGYLYPTDDLPLTPGSDQTSSNFWWSTSKYRERWVAMMEKAFAMRYLDLTNDHPNVCKLPKGSPQFALYILMGDENWEMFWNSTPAQTSLATVWKDNSGKVIDVWNTLKDNCSSPTGAAFLKTKFPTVAFTFDSASQAPAPKLLSGGLLQYNSDLLVASHSYSVLGVYTENNAKYVVLRNPWGLTAGVTYGKRTGLFGCSGSLAAGPLPGFDSSSGDTSLPLWTSKVSTGQLMDGIFALNISTFTRYFYGFSWA